MPKEFSTKKNGKMFIYYGSSRGISSGGMTLDVLEKYLERKKIDFGINKRSIMQQVTNTKMT